MQVLTNRLRLFATNNPLMDESAGLDELGCTKVSMPIHFPSEQFLV